ncbi:MAG: hypothetical protein PUD93_11910 [Lachnospiraceae bacterium]|nr:hypothetical protein [Lachnospiraceae bacterium]
MEQNEINIPEIPEKKNKKKIWLVAAGILAACLLVGTMAFACIVKLYNTSERKLLKGFISLAEEFGDWNEIWKVETGKDFANASDRMKLTTIMNVSGEDLPITLGIDVESMRDMEAKRLKSSLIFSVSNTDLAEVITYADEKKIMLAMPDFFRQNLSFQTNHIERQYNQSLWAEKFGKMEEEEISIDLFAREDKTEKEIDIEQLINKWKEMDTEGITIEEMEETVDHYTQYRIVLPQELVESIIKTEELASDVALLVSMDKRNRIMQIQFEEPVLISNGVKEPISVSGSMMFLGEERSIDDIAVRCEWDIPMDALELDEKTKEALEVFGNKSGLQDNIEFVTDMNIALDENDISVVADLNKLTISVDRLGTYKITGSVKAEPLKEEIRPLEGETISLFEITEEEYEDLTTQISHNLYKWIAALESVY